MTENMEASAQVVIVNYHTDGHVRRLVADLGFQTVLLDVLIVNNAPSQLKAEEFPVPDGMRVRVRDAPRNLGYLPAVDWAITAGLLSKDCPVVVTNPDIRVPRPDTVALLVSRKDSLCTAPQVLDRLGNPMNPYRLRQPSLLSQVTSSLLFMTLPGYLLWSWWRTRRVRRRQVSLAGNRTMAMWAPHGAFFVLFPEFFRRGGRIPSAFLFGEEELLGEQLSSLGGEAVHVPAAVVEHVGGVSTGRPSPARWRLQRAAAFAALRRRLQR